MTGRSRASPSPLAPPSTQFAMTMPEYVEDFGMYGSSSLEAVAASPDVNVPMSPAGIALTAASGSPAVDVTTNPFGTPSAFGNEEVAISVRECLTPVQPVLTGTPRARRVLQSHSSFGTTTVLMPRHGTPTLSAFSPSALPVEATEETAVEVTVDEVAERAARKAAKRERRLARKASRLALLSAEEAAAKEARKAARRAAKLSMTAEELVAHKQAKREARRARKEARRQLKRSPAVGTQAASTDDQLSTSDGDPA